MANISTKDALNALFTDLEQKAEEAVKAEIKATFPIFIERLKIMEIKHPGFLGILKLGENLVIDVLEVALTWANS